ncbi:sensor histidine kinase [Paenibacillus sp. strain BS8-2]
MIRSLYVRIVATFLLVVVLSIALAFLLTNQIFQQSHGSPNQNYHDAFERIRQLHNVAEPSSLPRFLEEIADMEEVSILAVSTTGEHIAVGEHAEELQRRIEGIQSTRKMEWLQSDNKSEDGLREAWTLDATEESDRVERDTSDTNSDKPVWSWGVRRLMPLPSPSLGEAIGRLVTQGGEQWSIFLQHNRYPRNSNFILTAAALLMSLLIIGSILILFAARFLVRPIKTINDAALQMSAGNFSVRLPVRRKDELGALAYSMNTMADGLSRIETMRQNFVANVSHEIQSPLTSIHGFAEALRSTDITEDEKSRYVGIIQQESNRLSKISENLLKLSALDAEQHPFRPMPYRLDRQLREALLACEPAWRSKSLHVELRAEEMTLIADAELMSVVWTNLLTNGIKFTPEGGAVVISMASSEKHILVTVQDTGPGISSESSERVFERFYKADSSRNRTVGGSGLGLAITRKIVELHGGTIELQQEHNTGTLVDRPQGACFIVKLPTKHALSHETQNAYCFI